jgi:hypothetical protein
MILAIECFPFQLEQLSNTGSLRFDVGSDIFFPDFHQETGDPQKSENSAQDALPHITDRRERVYAGKGDQ